MYYIYSGFNMSMYNAADNISEIRCKGTAFSAFLYQFMLLYTKKPRLFAEASQIIR